MEKLVNHDRLGYRISSKYSDQFYYQQIKKFLTVSSQDYYTKKIVYNEYFYETEKALLIPRLFPIEKYFDKNSIEQQEIWHSQKIKIKSSVTPRNKIQEDSINHLLNTPNCLLQLDPGSGKTVIAIDVMCKLKYKTIIIVHRDSLMEQWHDRLKQFSDISEDKIGVLNTQSYDYVLKNSDIILSTVQAFNAILRNKKHERNFQSKLYHSGIGLMISDEVHTTVGAPTFSRASLFIPCHRTIGLSATPDREDGTFKIMKYHLGEVFISQYASGTMDAEVNVIMANFDLLKNRERWLFWEGQFQYSRYYQILKNSKIFLKLMDIVINTIVDQNRHAVIMGERIKLFEKLTKIYKDYDCFIFKSGVKNDVLTKKLIFTTPGKMRDGIDAPWKDTLIMTSPINNISQATGRIVRSYEGKPKPLVIDFVDTGIFNIRESFRRKRLPFYNKKNWIIKYYAIEKGVLTEMGKDKAFRLSGMNK